MLALLRCYALTCIALKTNEVQIPKYTPDGFRVLCRKEDESSTREYLRNASSVRGETRPEPHDREDSNREGGEDYEDE